MDMNKLPFVYQDMDLFRHKIVYYESSRGCPFFLQLLSVFGGENVCCGFGTQEEWSKNYSFLSIRKYHR